MPDIGKRYWIGFEALDWISEAGLGEIDALAQIHRAIWEGKLGAIGRKCEWRDNTLVSWGEMSLIPSLEALDLTITLSPDGKLMLLAENALLGQMSDDGVIDPDNIQFVPNSMIQRHSSSWGWSNVLLDSSGVRKLWPIGSGCLEVKATAASKTRCRKWLEDEMRCRAPLPKQQYRAEAQCLASDPGFARAWAEAVSNTGATEGLEQA